MSGRTTLANKGAAAATGRNRRHAPRSGHFSADPLQHTASDSSTTLGIRPRAYRAQNISQGMHLSQKNPGPGPAWRVSLGSSTTLPWTRLCGSAGGFLVLHFWRLPAPPKAHSRELLFLAGVPDMLGTTFRRALRHTASVIVLESLERLALLRFTAVLDPLEVPTRTTRPSETSRICK